MSKNFAYLIFDDYCFDFISNNFMERVEIPRNILIDGIIVDKNYLYYILKKFFENNDISEKEFIIFNQSSKIFSLKLKLPKISEEDIRSMIGYEIENLLPIKLSEYEFVYTYTINSEINVDVRVARKDFIADFEDVFKNLNKKLKGFYFFNDFCEDTKFTNFISLNFGHTLIKNSDVNKSIYNADFYEIFNKYNLEYFVSKDIMEKKFVELEGNTILKIENNFDLILYKNINLINKSLEYGATLFTGNLIIDKTKTELEKISNEYFFEIDYKKFNPNKKLNFIKEQKKKVSKIYFYALIFFVLNFLLYIYISNNINIRESELNELNNNKEILDNRISELNYDELKQKNEKLLKDIEEDNELREKQKSAVDFGNLFLELEDLEDDEILFTDYYYYNAMYVNGIAKNEKKIEKILEGIKHKSELLQSDIEDGVIKFKIKIEIMN
ncbi:hypothetical protein [Peptoniphilus mikwangii]|uniref:hypothetical protein n=1 Tax=Peptoniphilus mikwangii TaxID=1354300 RepID=UPI0003F6C3BE|nr:hypothetical protein [Peptoniphilus mikwangii]